MPYISYIFARKSTRGYYMISPRFREGIKITFNNIDTALTDIYINKASFIYGYKTMSGARKKIISILTNK